LTQNYAAYLYRKAFYLWHKRDVDTAGKLLLKSETLFLRSQRLVDGDVDPEWRLGYKELQETLSFFRKAGLLEEAKTK